MIIGVSQVLFPVAQLLVDQLSCEYLLETLPGPWHLVSHTAGFLFNVGLAMQMSAAAPYGSRDAARAKVVSYHVAKSKTD